MENIKINEIKADNLVKRIPLGTIVSAWEKIKLNAITLGEIDYATLEAMKAITLLQAVLKDEFYHLDFEGNENIYSIYDTIIESRVLDLLPPHVDTTTFYSIINKEIAKVEAEWKAKSELEEKLGYLLDMAVITLDKISDKKYANALVKTFATNAPKTLITDLKSVMAQIKK